MKAIVSGTFDPFTLGHRDIAERALSIFGSVIIAVAEDTGKRTADIAVRKKIAELSVAGLSDVQVMSFSGLLTDFAKKQGECILVRGVRGAADLEYERSLSAVYNSLSGLKSVFLPADPRLEHISSTVVRSLAPLGASLHGYVASEAMQLILKVYGTPHTDKE